MGLEQKLSYEIAFLIVESKLILDISGENTSNDGNYILLK